MSKSLVQAKPSHPQAPPQKPLNKCFQKMYPPHKRGVFFKKYILIRYSTCANKKRRFAAKMILYTLKLKINEYEFYMVLIVSLFTLNAFFGFLSYS